MTHDRRTNEPILLDLSHSAEVYRQHWSFLRLGPVNWDYPSAATATLLEAMPWEALVLALVATIALYKVLGPDGLALGYAASLGLVALELFGTKAFLTATRAVRQHALGPFIVRRAEVQLAEITSTRVEGPDGAKELFGDIVLVTPRGSVRFRSVPKPDAVLRRIHELRGAHP